MDLGSRKKEMHLGDNELTMKTFEGIRAEEIYTNLLNLKQLTFEVTDACNLQCKYCGYGDLYYGYDKRESMYLPVKKAKLIIDYLVEIWKSQNSVLKEQVTYISFYGGEPLLNMSFIKEVVAYIESLDVQRQFQFSMTTNAMFLDKHMDYLVEKNFGVLISLDGDKEGHSYREMKNGENSFDTVFENAKKIKDKYPEYFQEHINFNSVLHNKNSVERTFRFIKDHFGKEPTISELNNSEIREDRKEEFDRTYKNKSDSILSSENYEKLSDELFLGEPKTNELLLFLHQYSGNVFTDYKSFFVDKDSLQSMPTGTCPPFNKKMFITVNGKILQCERIDHIFTLGEITDDKVILNLEEIASKFNSFLFKLQSQCLLCYRKKSCTQCLYYIPDINGDSPICRGFMNEQDYKNYTSYCLGHLSKHPDLYEKIMTEVTVE